MLSAHKSLRSLPARRGALVVAAALSIGVAAAANGQGAIFRGRILSASDVPLASVEVFITELARVALTDTTGLFVFRNVPAGTYGVTLRRPQFRPISGTARFTDGDSLDMRFRMQPLATLDSVRVTAREPLRGSMAQFERRRAAGFGVFISQDMLERREDSHLSEIILLQYTYTTANRVQPFNLDDLAPSALAGIEVYRGAAETPSEFNGTGSACGTIAIWTRIGAPR